MAVRSLFSSVSTLASGAVDAPVRTVVEAVLNERGFVDHAAFAAAEQRLAGLEQTIGALSPRIEAAEQRAGLLAEEVQRLQSAVDDLTRDLADARTETVQAVARTDEAERARAELAAEVEALSAKLAAAPSASPTAAPTDDRPVVGPAGEVEVRGKPYFVDATHAGERYSVAHNGAVRVGRRLVKKSAEPRT